MTESTFHHPALVQVRQVKRTLPELDVNFPQAEAAIRELGQQARSAILGPGFLDMDPLPLEVVHLFPRREPFAALKQAMQEKAPQPVAPSLRRSHARNFQVFQLLVLLFTRRLHLGDVLLFALDRKGHHLRPEPRPELMAEVGWLYNVRIQHEMVRQALRWLLALREGNSRWITHRRMPDHLGWHQGRDEHLIADLLTGRRALYLHQVFELLMLLRIPVRTFVRYLYFMDSTSSGTSREFLRTLKPHDSATRSPAPIEEATV